MQNGVINTPDDVISMERIDLYPDQRDERTEYTLRVTFANYEVASETYFSTIRYQGERIHTTRFSSDLLKYNIDHDYDSPWTDISTPERVIDRVPSPRNRRHDVSQESH